ncbi:MAG: RecQ family ATP-dependent DNA helicase [Xenococcaceae cyanobacterium MO_188.B32]|nr:RecQ family ATP-dependent DNA helicase [Xenococcaceae cyanobacterium MO_188.B32]
MTYLPELWQQIHLSLKQFWGYESFRYPQAEIIESVLKSRDTLVVMPTGGGKSLCFQLPALVREGLTLVVSPLVALMENQVKELQQRHLPAALLHSELPRYEKKQILSSIEQQRLKLLYLSPETLLSLPVWQTIAQPQVKINSLILDEAHCLVQWGTTFRPAYRRLQIVRPSLLKSKPPGSKIAIAAFTATADAVTQKAIIRTLQLKQPKTFLLSPYRANLHLQVKTIWTPKGKKQQTLKFIQNHPQQSGLIYVRSRRDSEELANWFDSLKLSTKAYHAGLDAQTRRRIEQDWLTGKITFVICTSAFGMGINKPNCRWIVHFQLPELLSEYLQEIGRGGRDGQPANALILVSEPTGWLNPEDKQRSQFFLKQLEKQWQQAQAIAKQIPIRGKIATIEKEFLQGKTALGILHSLGQLEWQDPFSYQKCAPSVRVSWENLITVYQRWQKQMNQYLRTKECRWKFLLTAFNFTKEARDFRCGHCDNCWQNSRKNMLDRF